MYQNRPKWKIYLSIALSFLILCSFYQAGVPLSVLPILGVFFILIILLRGPLYKKIDEGLVGRFSFFEKLSPWAKKLLVIIIFLLAFTILKQGLFYGFKLAGVDLQQMIKEGIYQSLNIEEEKDERCSWQVSQNDLEELGLHCSAIVGYYYGPAIVGTLSEKYECNPVPGCYYDPEIVPFRTLEECKSTCE